MNTTIDIRKADARPHTKLGWLDSHHSFSFGRHYDPANTHHGLLLVSNDDRVAAGTGFSTHPHQDMEIVTWVLVGSPRAQGLRGQPGRALSRAGPAHERGHRHLALRDEPVAPPRTCTSSRCGCCPTPSGSTPATSRATSTPSSTRAACSPSPPGQGHDAAISIRQRDAVLWGGRLKPGEAVDAARRPQRPPLRRRAAPSTSKAPARSSRATPPASSPPAPPPSRPAPTAPRS